MRPSFMEANIGLEILWSVALLVVAVLLAFLVIHFVHKLEVKLQGRSRHSFFPQLIGALQRPFFMLFVSLVLVYSLSLISYFAGWQDNFGKINFVLVLVIMAYTLSRISAMFFDWYLKYRPRNFKIQLDPGLVSLLRRSITIILYLLAILVILEYLEINISPLIAGLGIGGLAIALALQPALGNFFAGTQIVSDKVVRIGDYIELENRDIRGYVTDIGWRSTRIRTPFNNMIIIPNSRLSDSILINYYEPDSVIGIMITAGVSYDSDLEMVEKITLEVAKEVLSKTEGAVKDSDPWFGYDEFGDFRINFWIWVEARDRMASFKVKSELIRELKTRFDKEGIRISFPARDNFLHWPKEPPPPGFLK